MKTAALLSLTLLATLASADVESRFDTDTEGWLTATVNVVNLETLATRTPTWNAGRLEAAEFSTVPGDLFALVAPAKFVGDKSAFYGGTVVYRLSSATNSNTAYPNLLLRGNGIALAYVTPPPAANGTDFSIGLTEKGWITFTGAAATREQFVGALSNLDTFGINADWTLGGADRVTLDDVVMAAPVPEPATLLALGLGVVGSLRRFRSRTK